MDNLENQNASSPHHLAITVRYFASLREALGAQHTIHTPASTVGELRQWLAAQSATAAAALAPHRPIRAALDQRLCDENAPLHAGAEVAFFPPVTGG